MTEMMKDTVVLGCTSLKDYIEYTQEKLETNYPVIYLSKLYHRDPAEMRAHIIEALEDISQEMTVLVSMGYCGGSWKDVKTPCRLVMPRIDDCISFLLQTGDEAVSDLKKPGHLYVKDKDPASMSFRRIFERLTTDEDEETKKRYHDDWKSYYHEIDIIDTGINGCRRPGYAEEVKADADWLDADMAYVPGGNHLLEKLLKGDWDEQFLVFEAGQTVKNVLL